MQLITENRPAALIPARPAAAIFRVICLTVNRRPFDVLEGPEASTAIKRSCSERVSNIFASLQCFSDCRAEALMDYYTSPGQAPRGDELDIIVHCAVSQSLYRRFSRLGNVSELYATRFVGKAR